MANRTIEAELLLTAKDRTKRAFDSVSKQLAQAERQAKKYNRQQSVMARRAAMAARGIAAVGGAAVVASAQSYRKFSGDERTLTRIGITAEATREQMAAVRDELYGLASNTGMQFSDSIKGLDALTASGRSLKEAMALLPSVMATAQASGADVADIATSADALAGSLKISGENMQTAFDIIVAGGKAGKFELRDMAQFIPSLAPAFQALGYEGEKGLQKLVAALQVVRKTTGTSGEAATAFMDVIQKMETDTVTNKFKKFGVDLRKELAAARKEGKDVLETFINLSREAISGDMSKLPQLFADKQLLTGMRALMNGADDMERFMKALSNVKGTTLRDLGVVLDDQQAKLDKAANSAGRLASSLGAIVAGPIGNVMDGAANMVEREIAAARGREVLSKKYGESATEFRRRFREHYRANNDMGFIEGPIDQYNMAEAENELLAKWVTGGFKGDPMDIVRQEADKLAAALRAQREGLQSGNRGRGPVPTIDRVSPGSSGLRVPSFQDRRDRPLHVSDPVKVTAGYQQAAAGRSNDRATAVALLERFEREAESRQQRAGLGKTIAPLKRSPEPIDESNQAHAERVIANIRTKASVDTSTAMQNLKGLQRSAEKPMARTLHLNTSVAEQAIDRLHRAGVARANDVMQSLSRSMNQTNLAPADKVTLENKSIVDTDQAFQSLAELRRSAEAPMTANIQLNTDAIEQNIDRLRRAGVARADDVMQSLSRPIDQTNFARAEKAIFEHEAVVDTGQAFQSLEGLRRSAETPMAGTVQLNTGAAEQAIDRLHSKGQSLLQMLGQVEKKANNLRLPSGSGGAKSLPRATGNRRRTMPDAGIAKP
ncbi:MAG: phage tail tape measure protein [Pseudomonadota bacterium]